MISLNFVRFLLYRNTYYSKNYLPNVDIHRLYFVTFMLKGDFFSYNMRMFEFESTDFLMRIKEICKNFIWYISSNFRNVKKIIKVYCFFENKFVKKSNDGLFIKHLFIKSIFKKEMNFSFSNIDLIISAESAKSFFFFSHWSWESHWSWVVFIILMKNSDY